MKKNKLRLENDYNILSLDGGGIRGIMLLCQLVDLEKKLDKPIHETFDLISGTSTGAIVAVLLAMGYTASDILSFYLTNAKKIFKKRFLWFGIFRPKYSDKFFNSIIKKYVGDKYLSDLSCDVIITAYNVTKKRKLIFKSKNAKVDASYNYKLFDVIRSSASAQTFFKPHKIGSSYFIDGGMVINNPTLISYIEAIGYKVRFNNINVLSYSTGIKSTIINKSTLRGGIINWAKPTVDILLAEQSQITDYHMKELGINNEHLNYIRCESYISNSSGKIDDVSRKNLNNLIRDGKVSAISNRLLVEKFISFI